MKNAFLCGTTQYTCSALTSISIFERPFRLSSSQSAERQTLSSSSHNVILYTRRLTERPKVVRSKTYSMRSSQTMTQYIIGVVFVAPKTLTIYIIQVLLLGYPLGTNTDRALSDSTYYVPYCSISICHIIRN